MATQDDSIQQRLLAVFRIEAPERLGALSSGLIELEGADSATKRAEILEALVREAHSLKGAARAVNFPAAEALAREMEKVLAAIKQRKLDVTPGLLDALHRAVDAMERFVSGPAGGPEEAALPELLRNLARISSTPGDEGMPAPAPPAGEAPPSEPVPAMGAETVRISAPRLGALLRAAEQLLSAKLAAEQQVAELRNIRHGIAEWKKALAKSSPGQATLESAKERLDRLEGGIDVLGRTAEQNARYLGSTVSNVLEGVKSVLMLPLSNLLGIFPKMVRDLSRDRGKEVDWIVTGSDIEIDKRILDELKDPFIHLVRNCIDHGIEKPEQREAKGKPRRGRITFSAAQTAADRIEITLGDDGAGMAPESIRAAAVKHGVVTPAAAAALSETAALDLVFRSGVTTSPMVTDLSGRGLGLPIVHEKIGGLNGTLSFDTAVDHGTVFRLSLPLTVATFRGVVVECAGQLFAVPTAHVERVLRIDRGDIRSVENRAAFTLRDRAVSMVRMADALGMQAPAPEQPVERIQAVVLGTEANSMAFSVDAIHNEQEILVKPLGRQLARVRNIAGATVLGSGRIVPVLNVPDLLASAVKAAGGPVVTTPQAEEERKLYSLLVVEDSITTRTLLKNILEAAKYRVVTAVDGVDALARLGEEDFDLVVSDIDMPRMNGFELTSRVRAEPRLADLPIVLVTALESARDRERGMEAGATAYIVKTSFDQSNLLEVVRRLIRD